MSEGVLKFCKLVKNHDAIRNQISSDFDKRRLRFLNPKLNKQTSHEWQKDLESRCILFQFYINIWDQKMQNSVFYEAFLPITWMKPSAGLMIP